MNEDTRPAGSGGRRFDVHVTHRPGGPLFLEITGGRSSAPLTREQVSRLADDLLERLSCWEVAGEVETHRWA